MNFKEIKKQMDELKAQAKAQAQGFFNEGCKELFAACPGLESFAWKQYTPYFNDGDPCVFSAYNDDPYVNGFNEWGEQLDGEEEDEDFKTEEWKALHKAVKEFLENFDNDDLLGLFGDHVSIEVTREGITTEEYEHD